MLRRARIETPERARMPDFQNLLVRHGPWIIALAVAGGIGVARVRPLAGGFDAGRRVEPREEES